MKTIIKYNLFVSTVLAIAGILGHGGNKVQALTFNFTPTAGTSQQAINGFTQAGNLWSSLLSDSVTVNINIGFSSLVGNTLGNATTTKEMVSFSNFRNALKNDATSLNDSTVIANLPNSSSFNLLINLTGDNPNGSADMTRYLDNDGSANNSNLRLSTANMKALGLSTTQALDASISFNSNYSFDFNRDDGISAGAYDFVGIAAHEIGHALGFLSGVDVLDYNPSILSNNLTYVTPLDLFRFSPDSYQYGKNVIDLTADTREKYFSLDGGTTVLIADAFSTGVNYSDGYQARHWKKDTGIGIMGPTAETGELLTISNNDVLALDAIGWNVPNGFNTVSVNVSASAAIPEPLTILGAMTAVGFGVAFKRKSTNSEMLDQEEES